MNNLHAHPGKPRPLTSLGAVALTLLLAGNAGAQVPVDANGEPLADEYSPLDSGVEVENPTIDGQSLRSGAELEALIGPIALYPDDLLAIVLPAATYPLEVVQAARFLESSKLDSALKPDEDWDDSIIALLNYPEVLTMMNDDIDWTWQLGEAVVDQQSEVVSAIESFRDRAYAAGNLKSDDYQTVSVDEGVIEIEPANEDVIYVPYYEPTQVVRYSAQPVYHYYPDAYPVYFFPYANNWRFGRRPFWGVTTAFSIGWASDRLHVFHPSFAGHPYYGHRYVGSYWRQPSISVFNNYYVGSRGLWPNNRRYVGNYWRPRHRVGPRPRYNRRVNQNRNRDLVARNLNRNNGLREQRLRNRNTNATGRREGNAANERRRTTSDRRANGNRGNRNTNSNVRRTNGNDSAIRFRARGNGAYTATRERRMQRSERSQDAVRNRANTASTRVDNRRKSADRIATQRSNRFSSSNAAQRKAATTSNRQRNNAARTQTRQRTAVRQSNRREAVNTRAAQRQTVQRQRAQSTARAKPNTRRADNSRQRAQRRVNTSRNRGQTAANRAARGNAKSSGNSSRSRGTNRSNRGSNKRRSN